MLNTAVPAARVGRPTHVEIDLEAFAGNLDLARRLGGPEREVLAVVKAEAYGHGAVEISREAGRRGASALGVATAEEARQLREAGLAFPIVILSEVPVSQAAEVVSCGCTQVLYTLPLAEALEKEARRAKIRVPVHLKLDTGMGRVGVSPAEATEFATRIREYPHLTLEGVMSHLSEADHLDSKTTSRQLGEFARACDTLESSFPGVRFRHIANSALLMRKQAVGNLTRPGIMLYGSPPAPDFPMSGELTPVMRFVTAVTFLKTVPAGTPLSYWGTFVTSRKSLIATLPVGYADGYPRSLSNRTEILIGGQRAPQVGNICMDMLLVDVTDVAGVKVGDEAVLIGRQGREQIPAEELAAKLETISYEIYCSIGHRVPRHYHRGRADSMHFEQGHFPGR